MFATSGTYPWSFVTQLFRSGQPSHGDDRKTFEKDFEDTKEGVIRIRKSKKNRQHNGQKKKYKRTNNDLQNIHIKLKIEYHEPNKNRSELRCSGRVGSSCSTSGTRRVNLVTNPVISPE